MERDFVFDPVDPAVRPAILEGLDLFFLIPLPPILAHRVALKALPHQDPAQVGVTGESDPKKIPGLPFLELGPWIHFDQGGDDRVLAGDLSLEDKSRSA